MYYLHPIGHIRSTLRTLDDAPRQGSEGAPDAWLEVNPTFVRGLSGIATGDEIIVVTWLHRADRDVLEVHPRSDPEIPLVGVFTTRSPHRPNPLGLHCVIARESREPGCGSDRLTPSMARGLSTSSRFSTTVPMPSALQHHIGRSSRAYDPGRDPSERGSSPITSVPPQSRTTLTKR